MTAADTSSEALNASELEFLHSMLDLARSGQAAELARAIDAGLPVNLTNSAGDSLLILAAYHCHSEAVRVLLDRGADTERVNDQGQTALAAATFRREESIMAMLLDAGADPAAGARSALSVAEFFGLADMTSVLAAARTSDRSGVMVPPAGRPSPSGAI